LCNLSIFSVFYVSLDHFIRVLLAFVVLVLVSSVLTQDIAWEERLQNDLLCVEWDVKPKLNQSITQCMSIFAGSGQLYTTKNPT